MKKAKRLFVLSLVVLFILCGSVISASANAGSPTEATVLGGIKFEKSEQISVLKEDLTIDFTQQLAKINATYTFKNTTEQVLDIKNLFPIWVDSSLGFKQSDLSAVVKQNDEQLAFEEKTYIEYFHNQNSVTGERMNEILARPDFDGNEFLSGRKFYKYTFLGGDAKVIEVNAQKQADKLIFLDSMYEMKEEKDDVFYFSKNTYKYQQSPDSDFIESGLSIMAEDGVVFNVTSGTLSEKKEITAELIDYYSYSFENASRYEWGVEGVSRDTVFNEFLRDVSKAIYEGKSVFEHFNASSIGSALKTIEYTVHFEPSEQITLSVEYNVRTGGLGGYSREIKYYLSPAKSWKSFENFNLTVKKPSGYTIRQSSLKLSKQSEDVYTYKSDTLPDGELYIEVRKFDYWSIFFFIWLGFWFLLLFLAIFLIIRFIVKSVRKSKPKSKKQAA